jgi:hypothetical protein
MTSLVESSMMPLEITFEKVTTPATFAHIRSADGVLGHAQELRERIPVGTWLSLQPELHRLRVWLTVKCGFEYRGSMVVEDAVHDLLLKVEA